MGVFARRVQIVLDGDPSLQNILHTHTISDNLQGNANLLSANIPYRRNRYSPLLVSLLASMALVVSLSDIFGPVFAQESRSTPTEKTILPFELDLHDRAIFLQQQIRAGEADVVLENLDEEIKSIELNSHRYDEALVIPLTLKGDALFEQEQFVEALDTFERARHIARVSDGLFSINQVPLLYREAKAFRLLGDFATSTKREEYAFEVAAKSVGKFDASLLPAIHRIADYYLATYNFFQAKQLYRRAVQIHQLSGTINTENAIPALRGVAEAQRLQRFPPYFVADPTTISKDVWLRAQI